MISQKEFRDTLCEKAILKHRICLGFVSFVCLVFLEDEGG